MLPMCAAGDVPGEFRKSKIKTAMEQGFHGGLLRKKAAVRMHRGLEI